MVRGPLAWIALVGCGSVAPPVSESPRTGAAHRAPIDAPAAQIPDALPDAVTAAPAWVFGYKTAERSETWTLRHADGVALVVVDSAKGTQRYVGTATGDPTLAVAVSTGTAKLSLDCKREKLAVSAKCNDTKAKPIDVLNCYHPDFKAPMPFGPAPGIEYVVESGCNGYRLAAP